MVSRTVILTNTENESAVGVDWSEIGTTVAELSQLYQIAKEQVIDLIIVEETRTDLKAPVATRVRRLNGLTEIWRLVTDDLDTENLPDHLDGVISVGLGQEGIVGKVQQILRVKQMLSDFGIVGRSPRIKAVAETIERIAPTDVAVLIVGSSGTGKEVVAQAIHANSERRGEPFVAINCGAIAEGVLESELFGHEKGAFTGSVGKREGLFHKAGGGTIFLDEIGETNPNMQVRLLRVVEDGTYYPVGSSVMRHAHARLISATNRDLAEAINDRQFREDLYFRIAVVRIVLPPLMDRKCDIQPLLQHFWTGSPGTDYTDSALELLMKYDWPGNVRQLKNFADLMTAFKRGGTVGESDVERFIDEQHITSRQLPVSTGKTVEEAGQELIYRAIISLGSEIKLLRDLITSHLPGEIPEAGGDDQDSMAQKGINMEQMEKLLIEKALEESRGNRKEAARKLGIGERTLYRKLNKYDLN